MSSNMPSDSFSLLLNHTLKYNFKVCLMPSSAFSAGHLLLQRLQPDSAEQHFHALLKIPVDLTMERACTTLMTEIFRENSSSEAWTGDSNDTTKDPGSLFPLSLTTAVPASYWLFVVIPCSSFKCSFHIIFQWKKKCF